MYGKGDTMPEKVKLTVRVDAASLAGAKRYVAQHQTSLSAMISHFLEQLASTREAPLETPVLRRLAGILPDDASIDEYREHLVKKYDV